MSRKFKLLNYIVTFLVSSVLACLTVFYCNDKYELALKDFILPYFAGIIVSCLVCALFHELGHILFGKIKGFALTSFAIWFFKWEKKGKKLKFSFNFNLDEAGYSEMVKKEPKNISKGLMLMTLGGLIFSLIIMLVGTIVFIFDLGYIGYCFLSTLLPVGAYFLFGNALPSSENGVRNDGAVLYGLSKNDDETKVVINLMAIQSELYKGKTFAEIDEKLYFDLPQLPEDNPNFIVLLSYRYNFYLDSGDFDNATKTTLRLLSLEEYMPKYFAQIVKIDALYNACTFDFNADKADELMYEVEKYLNKTNDATCVRVKLAYILNINGEKEFAEDFYKKGLREANKSKLKGLKVFESKLLEQLKEKI